MQPTQPRQGVDVLLVEDDRYIRDLMARVLAAEGYRIAVASDEAQALSLASRQEFSVVVTERRISARVAGRGSRRARAVAGCRRAS